jgi:hypothetical protein
MLPTIFLLFLTTNGIAAWSGILIDGEGPGKTQLYIPGDPPVNMANMNFGLPHHFIQVAVMLNGYAYFIGGYNTEFNATNTVTIFDPSTNTSALGVPMNSNRSNHAATVINNTVIVCGGWDGTTLWSSCEQYNPSAQKWIMITSLPEPNADFVMATLNNHVYLFFSNLVKHVYMFDGEKWVNRTSTSAAPFDDYAGIALNADRVLICGGYNCDANCTAVANCLIYSASNDAWTHAPPMAEPRAGHSMVMLQGE